MYPRRRNSSNSDSRDRDYSRKFPAQSHHEESSGMRPRMDDRYSADYGRPRRDIDQERVYRDTGYRGSVPPVTPYSNSAYPYRYDQPYSGGSGDMSRYKEDSMRRTEGYSDYRHREFPPAHPKTYHPGDGYYPASDAVPSPRNSGRSSEFQQQARHDNAGWPSYHSSSASRYPAPAAPDRPKPPISASSEKYELERRTGGDNSEYGNENLRQHSSEYVYRRPVQSGEVNTSRIPYQSSQHNEEFIDRYFLSLIIYTWLLIFMWCSLFLLATYRAIKL